MAGRAATAVKSATKSKPRATKTAAAKKTASGKVSATATVAADKPVRAKKRTKSETRTRIYWGVFSQSLKRVAVFEFDQKAEAEKRAQKLIKSSGDYHFIQKIKASVPA